MRAAALYTIKSLDLCICTDIFVKFGTYNPFEIGIYANQ